MFDPDLLSLCGRPARIRGLEEDDTIQGQSSISMRPTMDIDLLAMAHSEREIMHA